MRWRLCLVVASAVLVLTSSAVIGGVTTEAGGAALRVVRGGAAYERCEKTVIASVVKLGSININDGAALSDELTTLALSYGAGNPEFDVVTGGWSALVQHGTGAAKDYIALACAQLAGVVISPRPSSSSSTPTFPTAERPGFLTTTGGTSGVEAALTAQLTKEGGGSTAPNPGTMQCVGPHSIKRYTDLLCNWIGGNSLGWWAFVTATKPNATKAIEVASAQINCADLASGQVAAVEAWESSKTCVSPTGIYVPQSAYTTQAPPTGDATKLATDPISQIVTGDSALPAAATACAAGSVVGVRVDPKEPTWAAWYFFAQGASAGLCPSVGGLAHLSGGAWQVASGPVFDLACGAPPSASKAVLSALGASKTCPPAPTRFGALLTAATSTTTTAPAASASGPGVPTPGVGGPWTLASSSMLSALTAAISSQGMTPLGTGTTVWVSDDPNNPAFYEYDILPNPNDPSSADQGGGGVAELTGGTWMIAGPYSQGDALPSWVPNSVVSDFDLNVASS